MDEDRFDVIIGGGSFVGLAVALGLAKSAPGLFRIAIVEQMPAVTVKEGQFDGRSVALTLAARQMLEALGLWDRIAHEVQPVSWIDITDSELEIPIRSVLLSFDEEKDAGAPSTYILENALLRRALYEAVETLDDVQLVSPAAIKAIALDEAGARATLNDGRTLEGRLLVAADGQRSALRKMAGFKIVEWKSSQAAITGTLCHELPHNGRAVQHFLPSGPFAILPMTGNRSS
ncbi:MAG: FAD-dependent monooxygenase, partial [Hyphomicrobiales bacterium]|nr:FAD-dependent monooxygenase [Hyphomicrobiales bacterium]